MYKYLVSYIVNPFFYLLDYLYENFNQTQDEEEDLSQYYNCYYDIENDKIIIPYKNIQNKEYILKINRKVNLNLKEEIQKLKNVTNNSEPYISLSINNIDNSNVRKYFGPNGLHDNYEKISIKDILTNSELNTFEKLELIDILCEYKCITNINENILD